jgi:UDP-glucuronate decarboxylase
MNPHDGRVVSNFIEQALNNENITIYGDGEQTRSFCYVSDLVRGFIAMMNQDQHIGPINLGNPDERSVLNLAELIIAKIGQGKLSREPLPQDDPTQRQPDISLAKKILGWEPKIEIDEGLDKTIAYFKSLKDQKKV